MKDHTHVAVYRGTDNRVRSSWQPRCTFRVWFALRIPVIWTMRGDPSVSHYLQSNESRCIRRSSLPASNERLANISLLANHGFCGTLVTVRSPVGLAVYVSRNAMAAIIGLFHGHMTFEPQIVARRFGGSSGIVGSEYFASHPARMCRTVFRGPTGWSRVFLRVGSRGWESTGHRLATIFGDRCHWVAPQSVFRCPVDLGKAIHTYMFLSIVASFVSPSGSDVSRHVIQ